MHQRCTHHVVVILFKTVIYLTDFLLKIWRQIFLKRLSSPNTFKCVVSCCNVGLTNSHVNILHTAYTNFRSFTAYNKVIRKAELPQPNTLQSAHNSERESQGQGVLLRSNSTKKKKKKQNKHKKKKNKKEKKILNY